MKPILILLVCVISFNAIGQMDKQQMQYLNKIQKFRKMRNIGLVMVVAGATMGSVGLSRLIKSNSANPATNEDVGLWYAGGLVFTGGMPVSIIGHNVMRKYEKKLRPISGVSLNLQLGPQHRGLVLTYRF